MKEFYALHRAPLRSLLAISEDSQGLIGLANSFSEYVENTEEFYVQKLKMESSVDRPFSSLLDGYVHKKDIIYSVKGKLPWTPLNNGN